VVQDNYTVAVHPDYPDQIRITGYTSTYCYLTIALEDLGGGTYRPVTGWRADEDEVKRARPDPVPEQQPWRSPQDAKGWRTIYRGTGQRRQLRSSVVLELTPAQNEWIDGAAEAAGLTPHEFLGKLIDDARTADAGR
jgi:hypothetical protein